MRRAIFKNLMSQDTIMFLIDLSVIIELAQGSVIQMIDRGIKKCF